MSTLVGYWWSLTESRKRLVEEYRRQDLGRLCEKHIASWLSAHAGANATSHAQIEALYEACALTGRLGEFNAIWERIEAEKTRNGKTRIKESWRGNSGPAHCD